MRDLIARMLKRRPEERPTVDELLSMDFVHDYVETYLRQVGNSYGFQNIKSKDLEKDSKDDESVEVKL